MADSWETAEEVPDLSEGAESVWGPQATPEDAGATVWDEDKPKPARRMPKLGRRHKGNTKAEEAPAARQAAVATATGRLLEPTSDWREKLAAGERSKAISDLTDTDLTHNSGSGFGLA